MDKENQIDELEYQSRQLPESLGDIRKNLQERIDALSNEFEVEYAGQTIKVVFCPDWLKDSGMAHFEFYGAVSSTGYQSHFVKFDTDDPPTREQWVAMATEYAIGLYKKSGIDYLNQVNAGKQMALFG